VAALTAVLEIARRPEFVSHILRRRRSVIAERE
jgi:hypothetical protein